MWLFSFTFLGEKVLGIFAGHYEFAWDTPQQLNDQCYVVYMVARCMRGGQNKRDKQQIRQTEAQSLAHSGCVCVGGGLRVQADSTHTHTYLGHIVAEAARNKPTFRNQFIKHGHQTFLRLTRSISLQFESEYLKDQFYWDLRSSSDWSGLFMYRSHIMLQQRLTIFIHLRIRSIYHFEAIFTRFCSQFKIKIFVFVT